MENTKIYGFTLVGIEEKYPLLDPILAWSKKEDLGVSDRKWVDRLSNFFTKSFRIKDLGDTISLDKFY